MSVITTIVISLVCFIAGAASLLLLYCFLNRKARRKMKTQNAEKREKVSFMSRFGTMNLILVIIGVTLLTFTIVMIDLFKNYGTIPDTLVTCVFAILGGECGVMGWIKTNKDKNRDRMVELEDRKYYEDKEKAEYGRHLYETNEED